MNLRFSGNVVLILGGSCDLGLALALDSIHAGLHPVLTYRNHRGRDIITEGLGHLDGKYDTAHMDFNDQRSLTALFDRPGWELDYLVDLVQGNLEGLIASADMDEVFAYFTENISFRAAVIKRVARSMLTKKQGRLVFVSSSAAIRPSPGQGFYAAAKLASEALYRNLGLELGGRGITTVILRPGYIDAGRGEGYLQGKGKEAMGKVPIKRPLTPKEISEAILFYLSDSAEGFNATAIHMDGGLTAGK